MAKRRRLTPAREDWLAAAPQGPLETKAAALPPPIAQVAGEAAAASALGELAAEWREAREDGRLVQSLALDAIEDGWLVRDRLHLGEAEMADLIGSIRERGQQTPVEVVALPGGRYGLISGWRRLTALRRLLAETGDPRFGTVRALLRRPASAAEAYRAMVEENEIRVGLSYYERARIAAKSAEAGVHRDARTAVNALFAAASRAKRSKIASFLALHAALDGRLRFPAAIPERLGLGLARALEAEPALAERLRERLRKGAPATAEAETALLGRALRAWQAGIAEPEERNQSPTSGTETKRHTADAGEPSQGIEPVPGIRLKGSGDPARPVLTLSGPGVDDAFRQRLVDWLVRQG